jgi:hypothetical protein
MTHDPTLDEPAAFHPTKAQVLFVRQVATNGGQVADPGQVLDSYVFIIDFADPAQPKTSPVPALDGASAPSFAPGVGIVAIDRAGSLTLLRDGAEHAKPISVTEVPSRPTKPAASPDGQFVAFLAIPTPPAQNAKRLVLDDPSLFRYQGWVAPIEGGPARKVTEAKENGDMLVDIRWDGPKTLLAVYQVPDPRLVLTRIERIYLDSDDYRLIFFGDLSASISLTDDARFFARATENTALFSARGREMEETVELPGTVRSLLLSPDGRWALASVWMGDSKGANLWLIPTPQTMLDLAPVFGENP